METRDNPGDALVLKQKYNPEKWQYWNFSTGAKIVGNNSKFYFSPLDNSISFLIAATTWSYEP